MHSRPSANENYCDLLLYLMQNPNKTAAGAKDWGFCSLFPQHLAQCPAHSRCLIKCLLKSKGREGVSKEKKTFYSFFPSLIIPVEILEILGCCLWAGSAKYSKPTAQECIS